MMKYIYKASWSVVGGINLGKDAQTTELFQSEQYRSFLTNNPNPFLLDVDRETALGRLMLKGFTGQRGITEFPIALNAEIEEIKAERAKKVGSRPVLVVEASGDIETEVTRPFHEYDGFIVTFDCVNKKTVAQTHKPEFDAMKLAVALESEPPSRFAALGDGVILINEEGKTIYSISFAMSSDAAVSSKLTVEGVDRICSRYTILQRAINIKSVERLFSQMADYETDHLKVFLSGWAAIEILIAKSFKTYEDAFLSPLTNDRQKGLREKFLVRVKGVMKDKYRLTDKFAAVAAVLFPNSPENEIQKDFEKFNKLKKLRDSIFHGEGFSDKDLPVPVLAALLRKYILAYIEMPNQANPDDAKSRAAD
jgi:hypothetical protein